MDNKTKILKLFAVKAINESNELSNPAKIQLISFLREADKYQTMVLILDGKVTLVDEQSRPLVNTRFKELMNSLKKQ